jgi:hypothetical protein
MVLMIDANKLILLVVVLTINFLGVVFFSRVFFTINNKKFKGDKGIFI